MKSRTAKSGIWLLAIVVCSAVCLVFFGRGIMRGMGSLLISDGPPVSADLIIVLAGDGSGHRILKGAELAREGYAPVVLVSNGGSQYGTSESELATSFAVRHGYAPGLFVTEPWTAHSTRDEARFFSLEIRQRSAHKVLIVTTNWHTARAARIFRRVATDAGSKFYMVGVDDVDWHDGNWWIDRQGQKTFFLESVKTIADYLGL